MKLIVGLGNPGLSYAHTRHNIGAMVAKSLTKECSSELKNDKRTSSLSARCRFEGQPLVVALPLTFMNLSGMAVAALVRKYKVEQEELLVICDDLDLEFGRLRIRPQGSSGGHKGLDSIITALGTQEFARLRIGIGRPHEHAVEDYVLSNFTPQERIATRDVIDRALECCRYWIGFGAVKAMNVFNRTVI